MDQITIPCVNNQARTKLIQIFRYIQAFDHLQNPPQQEIENQPWILWFHDLPTHPCIHLNTPTTEKIISNVSNAASQELHEAEQDFILKVRRPQLTEAPEPAQDLASWLQSGWQNVEGIAALDPQKVAQLKVNPDLQRRFSAWKIRRDAWAEQERPHRRAMDLFERLSLLRSQLERESERLELMVGDGLLSWYPSNSTGVHHPVLLLRLQLLFDPRIPEFTLVETEQSPELYTALFQALPAINAMDIGRSRQDFEQNQWHPLDNNETSLFLKQLVNQLSPKGAFLAQSSPHKNRSTPLITRDPVFFLRNRSLGFSTALESILTGLPSTNHIPVSLTSLIGIDTPFQQQKPPVDPSPRSLSTVNYEDEQILFSKPTNSEQIEVAHYLEKHGAVLVQGPPGTGKTHTIANLLGHLLAQGKSVLVTSHTSKALRVVREKVVPSLQPLCVSILDDDSRKQMEHAVDAITERLASSRLDVLERETKLLTQQRHDLLAQVGKTRAELKEARSSEYRAIVITGQQYTPTEAARYIAQHQEDAAWLPGPVQLDGVPPLSLKEFVDLYQTNAKVSSQDEQEMTVGLPDMDHLLVPAEFARLIQEQQQFQKEDLQHGHAFWQSTGKPVLPEAFRVIVPQLTQAIGLLQNTTTRWQRTVILAGCEGGPHRQIWEDLIAKIQQVNVLAAQTQALLLEFNPLVAQDCPYDAEKQLDEIISYLEHHKNLGGFTFLTHKNWKLLIEKMQVQGRPPEHKEHFQALKALLQLQSARADLYGRWQRQMAVLEVPDVGASNIPPEQRYKRYLYHLRQALQWYPDTWLPLENALKQQGLLWDKLLAEMPIYQGEHADLLRLIEIVQTRLPSILTAESNRRLSASNEAKLQTLLHYLQQIHTATEQSATIHMLRESIHKRSAQTYEVAWKRLAELYDRQSALRLRHQLLTMLEKSAPGWSDSIRRRDGIHGHSEIPSNIEAAWLWQQLSAELERRSQISLETLQERLVRLNANLQATTTALVEKKAWAAQVRRTTLEQRQALQGWKETMRKVGKGTGKRAPRLQAEARKLLAICQTAVPVWIMPLSRVVQNFDPQRNHFDVVIIDEASQADIKALAAIYMGHQVIIVGDDEQVTPQAVGQDLSDVQRLIDEHLQNIPNAHLYDGKLSIYALAKTALEVICLREHFRCVSPIIQFSNILSYNGKIKPLRDDSDVKRRPPLISYRVKSSGTIASVNEEEAQTVTSLLVAATEQPEYQAATFGVISMVKDEQALRIDTLLRKYLSPLDYTQRQILCGNSAQFQGDERDVIFISMVDTPGEGPLTLRTEDANDYMYKKRFNVAASRARDQLWVVHSLDPDSDLKNGDIRKRLIRYAMNPQPFIDTSEQEQKTDSEFERQVMKKLMQAGYHVTPQWPVGSYRIDLVVEGAGNRLAIECDGDRWHTLENLDQDMERQAILERLGWRFARIRGSHFFRNPDKAMEAVFSRLRELEIPPEGMQTSDLSNPPHGQILKAAITRRAAELRREWDQSHSYSNNSATSPTVTRQYSPQKTSSTPFSLLQFLAEKQLKTVDKRSSGGSLWVIGGRELAPIMEELKAKGIKFTLASNGFSYRQDQSIIHASGWYVKEEFPNV